MNALPNSLLLASAGTGKTFRLTHHLIDVLLRGGDPGRILASTFTRKAAGEILDRVLERLVEGATEPQKLADLNAHLRGGATTAAACRALLARLVLVLDRFQVRTLDAFFVHVGHLFALDLGLPAGWTIADEHQEGRLDEEAIGRMLDEMPPQELLELLRGIPREKGAQRSVRWAMRSAIRAARAPFLESPPEAWERLQPPPGLEPAGLEALTGFVESMELPTTAKGAPTKHWQSNQQALLAALEHSNWSAVLEVGLVKKVLAGEDKFDRKPIEDDVRGAIETLRRHVAHELLEDVVQRNRATHALLSRFQQALDAVKRERGLLAFDDLPRALSPAGQVGTASLVQRDLDLDYRLDAGIDHLLLDEFQDTAPVQWRILERLVEEILAERTGERTFFCVGDVKQSIYGWRAAEPRLLAGMHGWYGDGLESEQLVDNWRSSAVVLDTVNHVFRDVAGAAMFAGEGKQPYREAAQTWQSRFDDHRARKELRGAALLLQAGAADEEGDSWEPVLELTVYRVQALVESAPEATVGVLLRSNKPIPRLLERLLAHGLRASGEGGNPLTDSRAVLHLLSALHLADHPGDSAAAFHVQNSPLWAVLESFSPRPLEHPAGASRALRRRLQWEGLGEVCARFLPAVQDSPEYGDWDRRRFSQLVDLAYTHAASVGLRAGAFVDLVREAKVEDPSSSQVKVMTVHASKGLEFDAVVLPELDEDLYSRGISVLTERPDPRRLIEACCVNPGTDVVRLSPPLQALHDAEKRRDMEESLCVLYVAMTRARNRLEMIVRESNRSSMTYAALLRDRLDVAAEPADFVLWSHAEGSEDWFEADQKEQPPAPPAAPPLALQPSTALRERPARSPSGEEGGAELWGRTLLALRADDSTSLGTLIHRWLEEVEWLDDFALDDAALMELGAALEPDPEARRRALDLLRASLGRDAVRAALKRPPGAGLFETLSVWRERRFSVVLEDAQGVEVLWSGAFDRVVLREEGGAPVSAEVLDYKTDRVEGDAIAVRVEHYRPQLESYRRALAKITGLDPKRVTASMLFLHPGVRVEL